MIRTKLTLSIIVTFIATWLVISAIIWLLLDTTPYKEVMCHSIMIVFMLLFGWLPCIPVYKDLEDTLKHTNNK